MIETGELGARMVLTGAWTAEADTCARAVSIAELELNYAKGWHGKDLSFLVDLAPLLKGFTIIDWTIDDISHVNALTKLQYINVSTYCQSELCFENFPELRECSLEWRPGAVSLFEHRNVRKVFLNNYPAADLHELRGMASLESLALASPRIATLAGVEHLTGLTFLGLYVARRLATLSGLEVLSRLTRLEVNDCSRISDITPVAKLEQLRALHLCNDGKIDSLAPLRSLERLEELMFYDSTNIVDGDLEVLAELPQLARVAFQDRRHYSRRRDQFPPLAP